MSTPLIPVLVALTVTSTPLPAANAAQASISAVVTDSTGVAQSPVLLTGAETPTPWAFNTSVAPGAGTVVFTALDTAGATIGTPFTLPFTIAAAATFNAPTGGSVTPVTNTVTSAAAHVAAARQA